MTLVLLLPGFPPCCEPLLVPAKASKENPSTTEGPVQTKSKQKGAPSVLSEGQPRANLKLVPLHASTHPTYKALFQDPQQNLALWEAAVCLCGCAWNSVQPSAADPAPPGTAFALHP